MNKTVNIIFQGAGLRNISFAGAVECFEDHGYSWNRIGGSSGGAFIASLLAVGYTGKEISDYLLKTDFSSLLTKDKLQSIPILGKPLGFLFESGIYTTSGIEKELNRLFKAKGKEFFKDILLGNISKLRLTSSDLSTFKQLVLPIGLKNNNFTDKPYDFSIAKAACMSLAVPYRFKPILLKDKNKVSHVICDGGLISNFPLDIFTLDDLYPYETIGLMITTNNKPRTINGSINLFNCTLDLVDTSLAQNDFVCDVYEKNANIITIPNLGVTSSKLNLSQKELHILYESGYKAAENYLEAKYLDRPYARFD